VESPRTVLVVDDEPTVRDIVSQYLTRDGFRVVATGDGREVMGLVELESPALIVLDVMLPGIGGLELCRTIRARRAIPVILLTARGEETDRIVGLELGADDYVTKPFSPRELVARVKAVLRRAEGPRAETPAVLAVGDVEVDLGRAEARVGGAPVALTTREFALLQYLAENHGLALSRRQLLDGAWGADWYGDERTVDVHVRQLRKKLGDSLQLTTVRGIGYRFG
jgi:DNA-binding response OmpR family regulator